MIIPPVHQFSNGSPEWFFLVGVASNGFFLLLLANLDHIVVTHCWFFVVSLWPLTRLLSNHKRFEVQQLTYSHTDFQLLPIGGLLCRCDNILITP